MNMQFFQTVLIFIACTAISCRQRERTADSIAMPKPTRVFSKHGVHVDSYDFRAFEPLLDRRNDTTYVVNFWATWCAPCVAELPHFEKITAGPENRKVKVILVSLDFTKQVETALIPYILKHKLRSKVVHLSDPDANAWIGKVDPSWSGAIPATLIYNKSTRRFYERSFTEAQLQKEVSLFNHQ